MDTIPYTFSLYCEFCTKPGWCLACLNVSSCSSLPCISRIKLLPGPDSSAAFIYHSLVGLSFRTPVCCRMYLAREAACTLLCCVKPTPQGCSSLQPLHWGISKKMKSFPFREVGFHIQPFHISEQLDYSLFRQAAEKESSCCHWFLRMPHEMWIYRNLMDRMLCTAELTGQQGTYPAQKYVINYVTIKNCAAVLSVA